MERLTFDGNFCDIAQCKELPCPYNGSCSQRKVWERLKAYEDTKLEPAMCANYKTFEDEAIRKGVTFKRIVALMEADKGGRLVVLPCKTRQEKLLEQYPTADVDENGILEVCPALLFASHRGKKGGCSTLNRSCDDCRKEFWGLWDEAALEAMKDGNG